MNFSQNQRIHILGICGTLMGSFAAYLKRQGITVTGSDSMLYPPMSEVLKKAGIEVFLGYSAQNLTLARPDLVVVGNVISRDNPEMLALVESGIPYTSLPKALEDFVLASKVPVVVAGTHGKTTTTSLLTHILKQLGQNPSYFIGGVAKNLEESFVITEAQGSSAWMVMEGDEYDTAYFDKVPKFTHYRPHHVLLTSLEFDHADIYKNYDEVLTAFSRLASLTNPSGSFVYCLDVEGPQKVLKHLRCPSLSYGFKEGAQSRGYDLTFSENGLSFQFEGRLVQSTLSGTHNALNILGALSLLNHLGLDLDQCIKHVSTFQGVRRRQDLLFQDERFTLIDDFAHHPTAVFETLSGLSQKIPHKRLVAFFEPRSQTSRRRVFQKDYGKALSLAQVVGIARPFQSSKINPEEVFSPEELVGDLKSLGVKSFCLDEISEASVAELFKILQPGDLVVVMSNGSFQGLGSHLQKIMNSSRS